MTYRTVDAEYSQNFLKLFLEEAQDFPEGFSYSGISGTHELYVYAGRGEYYPFIEIHPKNSTSNVETETTIEYIDFLLLDVFNSMKNIKPLLSSYKDLTWIMFWVEYFYWQHKDAENNPYSRNPYDYIWLFEQNISYEQKIHLLSCGVYKQPDGEMLSQIPEIFWTPLTDKVDVLKAFKLKDTIHLHM